MTFAPLPWFRRAALCAAVAFAPLAHAVDGVTLINQATVLASGGFPYRITQPGSYRLSGNLVVAADVTAIDVLASDVSLDLNGFSIIGPSVCDFNGLNCAPVLGAGSYGVHADPVTAARSITVRNGSVRGFRRGVVAQHGLIEGVHVTFTQNVGILLNAGIVRGSSAYDNALFGIIAGDCVVVQNASERNPIPFSLGAGSVFGSNISASSPGGQVTDTSKAISQGSSSCNGQRC